MAADNPKNGDFDHRVCLGQSYEQLLAEKIEHVGLGAAQALFEACRHTHALGTSVTNHADEQTAELAASGVENPDKPSGGANTERNLVLGLIRSAQIESQDIDTVKADVKGLLKKHGFPHPEFADKLDGVNVDDR
jgi:hypothetical protein